MGDPTLRFVEHVDYLEMSTKRASRINHNLRSRNSLRYFDTVSRLSRP